MWLYSCKIEFPKIVQGQGWQKWLRAGLDLPVDNLPSEHLKLSIGFPPAI